MKALLECGHRAVLGDATTEMWQVLQQHFHISKPPGDAVPISIYGDEVQVFDNNLFMCINWMSECSPYHTNARASRFLVAMIPAKKYFMHEKVNVTLQAVFEQIVASCNTLCTEGVLGLRTVVSSVRGDWKFLVQSLNLKVSANTNSICFRCRATKNLEYPMTDMSEQALWRTSGHPDEVWHSPPALSNLHDFSLAIVSLDILHMYHLGVGRDIVASVLVLLLRAGIFAGRNASISDKRFYHFYFM